MRLSEYSDDEIIEEMKHRGLQIKESRVGRFYFWTKEMDALIKRN